MNMKPGTYIQIGKKAISLSTLADWQALFGASHPSPADIATTIGWVWIALDKRRQGIREIECEWRRGETTLDQPPIVFDIKREIGRIDTAVQTYGAAYLLKQRNGRGQFIGVRWLDPGAIRPDSGTAVVALSETYYRYYHYESQTGSVVIPREDLIIIQDYGLSELNPMTPAVASTRLAAEVMRGIAETQETIFDNNGLPAIVVKVPNSMLSHDTERLRDSFYRFFNRGRRTRERPVTGVHQDVEIETINTNPNDLAMTTLAADKIDEILAAHSVPKSVAVSNASTYATAQSDATRFYGVLGQRFRLVADTINADPDMQRIGVTLVVYPERHHSQSRDEQLASEAMLRYVQAGLTPEAALWLVTGKEPDDWPEWVTAVYKEAETEAAQPDEPMDDERKANELESLRSYVSKGRHLKRPFYSDILTPAEIESEIKRMDSSSRKAVATDGEEYGAAIGNLMLQAIEGELEAQQFEDAWRRLAHNACLKAFKRGMGIEQGAALLPDEQREFEHAMTTEYAAIRRNTRDLYNGLAAQD